MNKCISGCWNSMKINMFRLFANSKWYIVLMVHLIFSFYIYTPVVEIAEFYQLNIPPCMLVFYLSFYRMLIVHGGLSILLFEDVPVMDEYSQFIIIRSGRNSYIIGYLLYILGTSLLYTIWLFVLSVIFTVPVIKWNTDWGVLIYTLAQSSGEVIQQTGISIPFVVEQTLINSLNPISATGISFIFIWLTTSFVGILVCSFRVLFSKMSGIITAGILVSMSMFSMFLGGIIIGEWLMYLSPVSWSNAGLLSWYGNGAGPSPTYALMVLIGGLIFMSIAAIYKFSRKDLK